MGRSIVLTVIAVTALTACATREDFVSQSNKANQVIEDAHNQILLTNVVRAYKRVPMHFTGIQTIKGPIGSASPTLAFKIPFGPDFKTNIYDFMPTIKPDTAAVDFVVYDKQDFMRGITRPIDPKVLQYYIDQGWPLQMILHLFVREVRFTDANGKVTRKVNYPQNLVQFNEFKQWVDGISSCRLQLKTEQVPGEYVGPPIDRDPFMKDPSKFLAARKDGFVLTEEKVKDNGKEVTQYRLRKVTEQDVFELRHETLDQACGYKEFQDGAASTSGQNAVNSSDKQAATANTQVLTVGTDSSVGPAKGVPAVAGAETRIYIRSTEAMVYYLGEIMRAKYEGARDKDGHYRSIDVTINLSDRKYRDNAPAKSGVDVPLFVVETDPSKMPRGAVMSVTLDSTTYAIPAGSAGGRSMHVLSLVTQLIGLNKNASELPQSPTIRFIP